MQYCFYNGHIIQEEKALVPLNDIGILRGYGVFDFLRTYNGKPFLLKEHVQRLRNSAKALSLTVPLSDKKIEAIIHDLLEKNNVTEAQIRIILTGGKTIQGMSYDPEKPTFAIVIEHLSLLPAVLYKTGAKLITDSHMRHVHTAKTTNYINAIALSKKRRENDAIEILYTFHDYVLECSTSNLFILLGNTLITPKDNVLLGITRNFLITLLRNEYTIEERDISLEELQKAEEVFITATNKEVLPIVKIDKRVVGDGKVGETTKKIMKKFALYVGNY